MLRFLSIFSYSYFKNETGMLPDRTIQLKSPKLGCIPIRPFLIFISVLGLFGALSYIVTEPPTIRTVVITALGVAFNVCLFYGALKYNDDTLGYSQKFMVFSMILSCVMLCIMPVFVTSFIASDYYKHTKVGISGVPLEISADVDDLTKKQLMDIFDERTLLEIGRQIPVEDKKKTAAEKFLGGFVAGEVVVFMLIFSALLNYMVYVMVKRLRKFIAARKEIDGNQFLA
ncbi:hypothetical protein L3Y34_009442 [Caenorhabditis briggsae]|uniref:Uncharacterized protein n=4 Tax=Caenorhabditis briggsae TaxID=6238 RepID=A0AAE9A8T0_CAEBR|nr:hypothetical protein L3Y34_009442 [Caenorhabditis briggsae]